ncbi:MAG: hypothetical protein ACOYB2_10485 [Limnohabitans sp.]
MAIRYGGADSHEGTGFRMTVEAPAGTTEAAPVLPGSIWKLGGTDVDGGGHKLVALVDNDAPANCVFVQAMERAHMVGPMTVRVLGGYSQIIKLPYLHGAAPTIGQSIQASATVTKVDGKAFADGDGYVLFVDTVTEEVEVLC